MSIRQQLQTIYPSVKDALFCRLLTQEDLGYLRKDNTIIGFEVVLDQPNDLSGYAIIAIQKHTILAYNSDMDEEPRLILFPSMDKLEDPDFDLLDLIVERKIFDSDDFVGRQVQKGTLREVSEDLIPPFKQVEVSDEMAEEMNKTMLETSFEDDEQQDVSDEDPFGYATTADDIPEDTPLDQDDQAPIDPPDFGEDPSMEFDESQFSEDPSTEFDESQFGEPDASSESEPAAKNDDQKVVPKTPRAKELDEQTFTAISQVSDYVIMNFGVDHDLATNVVTAALRSTPDEATQIDVAVLLFIKLLNDNVI